MKVRIKIEGYIEVEGADMESIAFNKQETFDYIEESFGITIESEGEEEIIEED